MTTPRLRQLPLFKEQWRPPWDKSEEPTPDVGDIVQLDDNISACDAETGKVTYMFMQHGVVTEVYLGEAGTRDELFIRWRCIAAPPHYPYCHYSNGREYVSPRWDLRLDALPIHSHVQEKWANGSITLRKLGEEEMVCRNDDCPCKK